MLLRLVSVHYDTFSLEHSETKQTIVKPVNMYHI